jgi:small subunit ribosomal protein S2
MLRPLRRALHAAAPKSPTTPPADVGQWQDIQLTRIRRDILRNRFQSLGSAQTRENSWQPHHSLHRPLPPKELSISALVAAGAHFGHKHTHLNPNFIPYAYGERAGITLIDMDRTFVLLRRALNVTRSIAQNNGSIVFVGTRADLKRAVYKAAQRMGQNAFYVGERWLPGTLTNRVHFFGPATALSTQIIPDLIIVLNPLKNMHVLRECALAHVPTIGIIDSNVDPRIVMYPIPANDDSPRAAELIVGLLSMAAREGVDNMRNVKGQSPLPMSSQPAASEKDATDNKGDRSRTK